MGKCLSMCTASENINRPLSGKTTTSVSAASERDVYEPVQKNNLQKVEKDMSGHAKFVDIPRTYAPKPSYDEGKIEAMFEKYKDDGEEAILVNGMEKFCQDLGVNPTDFVVLVLAWKFNASKMCRFTKKEFTEGCKHLKADTVSSIRHRMTEVERDVRRNSEDFRDLYRFTFGFGLDVDEGQRSLPVNMAVPLWRLVFGENAPEFMEKWYDFIEERVVKVIPRDTWNMFLHMTENVKGDLSDYDESEAWPSLFDDFVDSERKKMVTVNGSLVTSEQS